MNEDEINRIYNNLRDFTKLVEEVNFNPGDKLVIGEDDRQDLYELENSNADRIRRKLTSSTVLLTSRSRLTQNNDGSWKLRTRPRRVNGFNPCSNEKFADQETGGWCSGFLVGTNVIATAGHCIKPTTPMDQTVYIFGFNVNDKGSDAPTNFPADQVYFGAELIDHMLDPENGDYAIIRLDRDVNLPDVSPLKIRRAGSPSIGDNVGVIGYPSGLPVKIAFGDETRLFTEDGPWLSANLDTYGGNSGSPVFNSEGLVEGILVRGDQDYVINNNCFVSNVAPSHCASEIVTKASVFQDKIPN